MPTLTTGELARELGVSHSAILKWAKDGLITPELTTPGGHHRWDAEKVRQQLREQRQRGDS
ncbi:excisionase family DNA binding protein [Pseudonocardia hierapolitana]|uniref:Excisionase family DNA binding protein n=1 Tax=Pseudonocardia hierapolitana TaxID=1128676 RepID=A0A561SY06_9PSEU|nr:MerR family DNA-binding transcriptional regulator [Pseudonocardia hierapolitana]TWF79744.1 excisionase family DNA binding protein [Pseudonocardia hierapolitana]